MTHVEIIQLICEIYIYLNTYNDFTKSLYTLLLNK